MGGRGSGCLPVAGGLPGQSPMSPAAGPAGQRTAGTDGRLWLSRTRPIAPGPPVLRSLAVSGVLQGLDRALLLRAKNNPTLPGSAQRCWAMVQAGGGRPRPTDAAAELYITRREHGESTAAPVPPGHTGRTDGRWDQGYKHFSGATSASPARNQQLTWLGWWHGSVPACAARQPRHSPGWWWQPVARGRAGRPAYPPRHQHGGARPRLGLTGSAQ